MSFDDDLAQRVRELLGDTPCLSEKRMFGGLAFMIDRHMAVVVSGQGGLMVRVDTETSEELVETTAARLTEMRGRQMRGWLLVEGDAFGVKSRAGRVGEPGRRLRPDTAAKRLTWHNVLSPT